MALTIALALLVVTGIVGAVYLVKHHPQQSAPAPQAVIGMVTGELDGRLRDLSSAFADQIAGIPALVDAEVARLQADLAAAQQELAATRAKAEADAQAHAAALNAVAGRVAAAIGASPELPVPPPAPVPLEPPPAATFLQAGTPEV